MFDENKEAFQAVWFIFEGPKEIKIEMFFWIISETICCGITQRIPTLAQVNSASGNHIETKKKNKETSKTKRESL